MTPIHIQLSPPVQPQRRRAAPAGPYTTASPRQLRYDGLKRIIDPAMAMGLILLLSPFLLLISLCIVLDSRGSPLYKQWRRGRRQKPFQIYKFRTMERDAHQKREALFEKSEVDGIIFKLKEDPRVTRVGRFLRRYSLDEFPQLLNVMLGEMTLVGPRPFSEEVFRRLYEHPLFEVWLEERHRILPGMTGLWQVSGRSNLPFDKLMRMDLLYLYFRSWRLDLSIMSRTFRTVLSRSGAY